jgi:glycosyltransferase involved in cell wall biosynthesis
MNSPARRILLWTDDPGRGGVAQYNHSVLLALRAAGHEAHTVHTRAEHPLISAQREAGVVHHGLDYDTSAEFTRSLVDTETAERILDEVRPDLVIFSDGCPLSNFAARQVALTRSVPFLCVVGFVAEYLARQFPACIPVLARHYAGARAVVAVSEQNLGLLRRHFGLGPARGRVIHYGRPEPFFTAPDPDTRARLRAELGLSESAVVALTVARLTKIKGHAHLLDALSVLRAAGRAADTHFVWLGEGEQRAALAAGIVRLGLSGRVHLLGHRWDTPAWYDAADFFLLPSEHEGMPLAIMEAMAKGLPVAASAVSGIPEELGPTGLLLPDPAARPAECVRALAGVIRDWSGAAALRRRVGDAARARAATMFREERMLATTLELVARHLSAPVSRQSAPVPCM